jgi:hypothetical protein
MKLFLNEVYHYPPELMNLLIDAIPCLCKSKRQVLLFFKGAGAKDAYLSDIEAVVQDNRDSISKRDMVSRVLERLNNDQDKSLAVRREVIKRIVQFDSFDACWPNDVMKAKGYVAEIQKIVNQKDSFTRMAIEREEERTKSAEIRKKELAVIELRNKEFDELKTKFFELFSSKNPQERGRKLESILNKLFALDGVGIKESFTVSEENVGVYEQIDGAIELSGNIYLVEMKWQQDAIDVMDVSRHLTRMFLRPEPKGIFISYSRYTETAIQTCKEALSKATIVLCTVEEVVKLLENRQNLKEFLQTKIQAATLTKEPLKIIM